MPGKAVQCITGAKNPFSSSSGELVPPRGADADARKGQLRVRLDARLSMGTGLSCLAA